MRPREEMLGMASDLFKDCNGCRPDYAMLDRMSNSELVDYLNDLQAQLDWQMEADREYERLQWDAFEGVIENAIEVGAGDRATALRWLYEGSDAMDVGQFVWQRGLLGSEYGAELERELVSLGV